MTLQDKSKLDTLIFRNQLLSNITANYKSISSEIQENELDKIDDKKMLKKLMKLNDLMKQASELAKEIETNFYGY